MLGLVGMPIVGGKPPPLIVDIAHNAYNASTSQNVPLPSYQAGDLLVMIAVAFQDVSSSNFNTPSGWTSILSAIGQTGVRRVSVFTKVATGGEGSMVALSSTAGGGWNILVLAIRGHTSNVAISSLTNANSGSANPGSVTSTETGSVLYLACCVVYQLIYTSSTITGVPADYTLVGQYDNNASAYPGQGSTVIASAVKAGGAAEDPSAFSISSTRNNSAFTLAIG